MEPNKTSQLISIVLSSPSSSWPRRLRGEESTALKKVLLVQTGRASEKNQENTGLRIEIHRKMGKTHPGDWLRRLGAVILSLKCWCLLQNVIYPPPPLEAFNVDHKLGRTSGSKDIHLQNNKARVNWCYVLAHSREIIFFFVLLLTWKQKHL